MHYFNKGCFRGTLIQWWKCFLIFFLFQFCCYRFVYLFVFVPAGGFHIVFRADDAWHLTPSSKIQLSHYNSKLYITWLWIVQWNRNSLQLRLRLTRPMGLPGAGQRGWPWAWPDPDLYFHHCQVFASCWTWRAGYSPFHLHSGHSRRFLQGLRVRWYLCQAQSSHE